MYKHSAYGKDYPNYGDRKEKLVYKRPEEHYNYKKFKGESTYSRVNKTIIEDRNKPKIKKPDFDEIAQKVQMYMQKRSGSTNVHKTVKMKYDQHLESTSKDNSFSKIYPGRPFTTNLEFYSSATPGKIVNSHFQSSYAREYKNNQSRGNSSHIPYP